MLNKTTFCFDFQDNGIIVHGNIFYYCDGAYYIVLNNGEITTKLMPNLTSVIIALHNILLSDDNFTMYIHCENDDTGFKTIDRLSNEKLKEIVKNYQNDDMYIYHRYPDINSLINDIKK